MKILSVIIFFILFNSLPMMAQVGMVNYSAIADLSYPFDSTTICWPTELAFNLDREFYGMNSEGDFFSANRFTSPEHCGTHIDAPIHFYENGRTVDQIPLQQLIGHGVVIDVSDTCRIDRDYEVRIEDILKFENVQGRIPDSAIVFIRTGFGAFWGNRKLYLGTDVQGGQAIPLLHFPGLAPNAALWLVHNRKIKAVGLDTPSIDFGQSKKFDTHVTLFRNDVPVFENLAKLNDLPSKDFYVVALPMKIKDGSGSPLRIVAMW